MHTFKHAHAEHFQIWLCALKMLFAPQHQDATRANNQLLTVGEWGEYSILANNETPSLWLCSPEGQLPICTLHQLCGQVSGK